VHSSSATFPFLVKHRLLALLAVNTTFEYWRGRDDTDRKVFLKRQANSAARYGSIHAESGGYIGWTWVNDEDF